MKRKIYLPSAASLFLVLILFGFSSSFETPIHLQKILVEPGTISTKVILETDAPLTQPSSSYSHLSPRTIIVDLPGVAPVAKLIISASDPDLIEKVYLIGSGENRKQLALQLKEQVPYRIYSNNNQTVIELNKIQRGGSGYQIDPEVQKALARSTLPRAFIKKIDIAETPAALIVSAQLSGRAVSQVFALDNPLRLVVDLFGVIYSEPTTAFPVGKSGLDRVRVAQFQNAEPGPITRLVFDLSEPRYYSLHSDEDALKISFYKDKVPLQAESSLPDKQSPRLQPANTTPLPAASLKSNEEKLEGVNPEKKAETSAQASPKKADSSQAVESRSDQEQEDKFKPKVIAGVEEKYWGEPITLRFKEADLRDVILFIGQYANLNVIFDPAVKGVLTCSLEDVPWDQALDLLLKNNKLGRTIEGNVLRVAPISVLTREDEELRKLRDSKEQAGPVQVKTITLSYSKAKDIQGLLTTKKSPRGEIIIDERTNTLIISDVAEKLDLLEKLISVLDTPTPQVSIEARIVEASSIFVKNLGVQWGFKGISDPFYGNQTSLQFPNKALVDGALIPQGIVTKGIGGPLGGYAINLPAPAFTTVLGFSMANILDTFRLDVALSALETSGHGRIISSPKITTQNNHEAYIVQGRQIPVQTVANFTVTTRYVNAALELRATPQITAEGTIIMVINIQNNAADFANLVNGIPPITTQSAQTTVMIPDGGTTVIGGIYRSEDSISREKVPLLHQIPILGNLFRSFARTKQNRELLIFITPRIIK